MVAVLPSGAMYYVWVWKNSGQSYREKLHGMYGRSYHTPLEQQAPEAETGPASTLPECCDPGVKTAETRSWRRLYTDALYIMLSRLRVKPL
jgi:hypothetical protein